MIYLDTQQDVKQSAKLDVYLVSPEEEKGDLGHLGAILFFFFLPFFFPLLLASLKLDKPANAAF